MRSRAGRIDLPGVAMVALLTTTVLAGCLTGLEPEAAPAVAPEAAYRLPAGLEALLGGDSPLLHDTPRMPADLADLMGRVLPPGVERLPLPTPPADEPMVAALGAYAASQGVPTPPADVLRPAVDALLLDDEAEQALAMLVLSYVQALDLQRQATERLLPHEVELLEQVDPSDPAALDAALAKIDRNLMLQGADLLARAAEAAKDPLGNPPLSLEEVQARRAATSGAAPATPTASAPTSAPGSQAGWDTLEAILAELGGGEPLPEEDAAPPTLAEAMASLAAVYGAPVPPLPSLPLSLDHAVASLVHAQAVAATGEDPARDARRLVATARAAEPTLRAWGAWLATAQDAAAPAGPDTTAFLTEVLAPSPSPAALVAAGRGRAAPEPIQAPPLSELLASSGMDAAAVAAVEASLGPEVSQGLAQLIAAALHVQGAYDAAMAGLPVQQQVALQHEEAIVALLGKATWSDSEAAAVEALALALSALSANGGLDAMQQAQEEALATVEEAVKGLTEALPSLQVPASHDADPLPHLPGTPSTDSVPGSRPGCVELPLGLSRCADDVLLRQEVLGHLVVVTGFGGTDLDPAEFGEPDIHVDLGGSDTYRAAMGAAETDRSFSNWGRFIETNPLFLSVYLGEQIEQTVASISLDLAGDDTYTTDSRVAQGSGSGISALGILWDASGEDRYEHRSNGEVAYGQGTGARGGIGILMDTGGGDRYDATGGSGHAQGAGLQGDRLGGTGTTLDPSVRRTGAAGLLLDLGAGDDRFTAVRGQGHSAGHGNTGLLLNQAGRTIYSVTSISPSWQGGRAEAEALALDQGTGPSGGLAALVDMSGAGDRYVGAGDLSVDIVWLPEQVSPRRQDDSAWIDRSSYLAVGLDSSLRDEDGDGWSSLAELLLGSDPHDPSDSPSSADPEDLVALIEELIAGGPDALTEDSDGDMFTDAAEDATGSDPGDAGSTPLDLVPLQSYSDESLCPSGEPCTVDPGDPSSAGCVPEGRAEPCISLLSLGMAGGDVHDHPAVVRIDLGGNDAYTHDVAGIIRTQQAATVLKGSFHLDLSGSDVYRTPREDTHGSAPGGQVSLLLDLSGDDEYTSSARSQGHGTSSNSEPVSGQAHLHATGIGILADLQGDDEYTFHVQGRGVGGTGVFLDGRGTDKYHSVANVVSPAALESGDEQVFSSQGGGAGGVPAKAGSFHVDFHGWGLFADAGSEWDEYDVLLSDGSMADASDVKNDVILHRRPGGGFADGLDAAVNDGDGDDAPGLVEALFGTHPGNGDDDRSIYKDTLEAVDEGRALLDSSWLLGAPGLVVGGRGDSVYMGAASFLVDLGGDDEYRAPDTASAVNGVALLLDVLSADGTSDDRYLPTCTTPTRVDVPDKGAGTSSRTRLTCHSLGGAELGVAVLADDGGKNLFHTRVLLEGQEFLGGRNDVLVRGLSQGAGALGGVGILATWDAENEFVAEVVADVEKRNSQAQVTLHVEGMAQGVGSIHGVGILAALGPGADSYQVHVEATAKNATADGDSVSTSAGGQGAASTALGTPKNPRQGLPEETVAVVLAACLYDRYVRQSPCTSDPGLSAGLGGSFDVATGILLDAGGPNTFHTTGSHAQGSGVGGILWSGNGDDTYTAGPDSQGSDGLLIDMGGNDHYGLRAPGPEELVEPSPCTRPCVARAAANSQGAGSSGRLLDLQGDDVHDATGWDYAQGAAGGFLLDLGGSDVYRAHDRSQGHSGLLLDLTGRDHYHLDRGDESEGQGYGPSGLFLDAGGEDRYDGRESTADGQRADDKSWTEQGGRGVDAEGLPTVFKALDATGTVGLTIHESDDPQSPSVQDPKNGVRGTVHLFATVEGSNLDVDRVTFLRDNTVLGHGDPVTTSEGGTNYHFAWKTDDPDTPVPDGLYGLVAAAFPTLQGDARVDLPASHSEVLEVGIDNPPRLKTSLNPPAFSPAQEGAEARLDVRLSRDLSFPSASTASRADGRAPGAWLTVDGQNLATDDTVDVVPETYLYGGNSTVELCANGCRDGRYNLTIIAADDADQTTSTFEFLLVDSRAPTTTISTEAGGGYANADDRAGSNLQIRLTRDDDPHGLGADNVAGIHKTLLVKLPAKSSDPLPFTRLIQNSDLTRAVVPLERGESSVRLIAVSVDGVGNEESPCRTGEDRYVSQEKVGSEGLCYRSGKVTQLTIDFDRPSLFEPRVDRSHIRPGEPVEFQVVATDTGTGIETVSVQIQDESPRVMTNHGGGVFVFDGWDEYNPELEDPDGQPVYADRETEYFFTITALDKAGNDRSIVTSGNVIDDRAPRVEPRPTRYIDPADDSSMAEGRPGTNAMLVARVTDLKPSTVASMHVTGLGDILGEEVEPIPCEPGIDSDFTLWGCEFLLVDSFPEGTFEVAVRVEDLAGNVNETATLPLVVDAEAVSITDLHVADVTHDGFTLAWKTSSPATSQVRYGQTPSVDRATQSSIDYVTDHSVEVRGLAPSTEYFFRAVSVSQSGVVSQSTASGTDVVETRNAFTVDLPGLTEGETLQGEVGLDLAIGLLSGSEPVDVKVGIQDADGRTTPRPLTQLRSAQDATASIETRTIPDGAYRFVVEVSRGTDRMTLKSPTFHIDNTPPALSPLEPLAGAVTADAEVPLRVAVVDTAGDLSDVAVLVDGNAVSSEWTVEETIGLQGGIIAITLAQPLADGPHTVEVVATDPVGNAGSTTWDFRIDTAAPETTDARVARYDPGPAAARAGATVHVAVNATDVSGVAKVVVDASALGASDIALTPEGLDTWVGSFVVPDHASAGSHSLPLVGTDHVGNSAPVGAVTVAVDRTAPSVLSTDTSSPNATAVVVRLRVDEPSSVQVTAGGQTFVSPELATSHMVNVTGLRPNTVYPLSIRATDGAGLATTATASQRTEPDTGAPTAPSQLLADASEEGVVTLSWKAAGDDSGIDSYLVTRTVGGTTETLPTVPGDELVLRDVLPRPVPDEATYHVRAVDLADQTGAAASVQAQVLSLPHLQNATLSPERGTTDDPFVAQVAYWSPNGRPADRVELVLGDHRFPLRQAEPGLPCLTACLYTAELSLPATSIDIGAQPVFSAASGDQSTELDLGWTPVVRSGADGIVVRGELETPGPSAPALLFLLLAALATLRSWRRRQ